MDGSTIRFNPSLFNSEQWDNPNPCLSLLMVSPPITPAVQDLDEHMERDGTGIQVMIPNVNIVNASVPTPFAHVHVSPDVVGVNGAPVGIEGTTPICLSPVPAYHDSLLVSFNPRVDTIVRATLDTHVDAAITPDSSKANSSVISLTTSGSTAAFQITHSAASQETNHPDQYSSLSSSLSNDDVSNNSSDSDSDSIELTMISAKLSPTNVGFPGKNPVLHITSPGECSLSGVPAILSPSTGTLLSEHLSIQICKSPDHPRPIDVECGGVSSISGPLPRDHPVGLYDDLDTWINNTMIPTTHGDPSKLFPPLMEVKRRKDEPHSSDSPNWANAPPVPATSRTSRCIVDTVQPINGRIDDMYIGLPNSGTVTYDHTPWSFSRSDTLIDERVVNATFLAEMRRCSTLRLTSPRSSASTAPYTPTRSHFRPHGAHTATPRIPMPISGRIWEDIELMHRDPRLTPIISVANIAQAPLHSNIGQSLGPEVKNPSAPSFVDWQDMIAATSDIVAEDYHSVSRENPSAIPNVSPLSENQSSPGLGPSHISGSQQQHQTQKNYNPPQSGCDYSNLNHNSEPLLRDAAIQKYLAPSQDVPPNFSLHDDKIPTTRSQWIALAELVARRGTLQHPPTQDSKTRLDDASIHDVNSDYRGIAREGRGTNYEHQQQPYDAGNTSPNDPHLSADVRGWHRKTKRSKPQEGKFDPQRCDPISTLHPQGTAQSRWADAKSVHNASKTTH